MAVRKIGGRWRVVSYVTRNPLKRSYKSKKAATNAARSIKGRYRCRYKCKK